MSYVVTNLDNPRDIDETNEIDDINRDEINEEENNNPDINKDVIEDPDLLELASILAYVDYGSYMIKKIGKSGDTPENDHLPYFTSMRKRWYYILWEGNPEDWCIVSFRNPVENPYDPEVEQDEKPIFLSEITDIFLEPPPNTGLRLYRGLEVIQLSPTSYSQGEAAAWADALRAAFALQDLSYEVVDSIRTKYYNVIANQNEVIDDRQYGDDELTVYKPEPNEVVLGTSLEIDNSNGYNETPKVNNKSCFGCF